MGVTAIKRIFNLSPFPVRFVNLENPDRPGNSGSLAANSTLDVDFWIPWCTEPDHLEHHSITLFVDEGRRGVYSIFQRCDDLDGDFVRLMDISTPGNLGNFYDRRRIGGDSSVNGDREMVVDLEGGIFLQRR